MSKYLPVFSTPGGEAVFREAYQATLEHWTASYREQYIPTSFGDVHVVASGPENSQPIILLHAFFASAAVWYPNIGALSSKYRVYAVDILGDANLSRPVRPVTSMEEFSQCFTELFDGLHIHKADLIGNSFGGFLAASLAMQIPQRVRGIVLLSPASTFHSMIPFYVHVFLPKVINMMAPRMPGQAGRIRRGVDWVYAGLPPDPYWSDVFYQAMLHGTGTNRVFPRVYQAEDFQKLSSIPALLLIGDHEKIYPPQDAIRAAKRCFPAIETEVIQKAHHLTALSNPEAVNRRILDFLSNLDYEQQAQSFEESVGKR